MENQPIRKAFYEPYYGYIEDNYDTELSGLEVKMDQIQSIDDMINFSYRPYTEQDIKLYEIILPTVENIFFE
jgi:hypothetical protein